MIYRSLAQPRKYGLGVIDVKPGISADFERTLNGHNRFSDLPGRRRVLP